MLRLHGCQMSMMGHLCHLTSHSNSSALFGSLEFSAPASHTLTPAQFAKGLRQPGAVLVDVRRPDEFASSYLPGAVNIEVTAPDFGQRVAKLDKTRPTYVYCLSGARPANAAGQLATAGFA